MTNEGRNNQGRNNQGGRYNVYLIPCKTSTLLRIGHTIYELESGYAWNTEATPREQGAHKIGRANANSMSEAIRAYRAWQARQPYNGGM